MEWRTLAFAPVATFGQFTKFPFCPFCPFLSFCPLPSIENSAGLKRTRSQWIIFPIIHLPPSWSVLGGFRVTASVAQPPDRETSWKTSIVSISALQVDIVRLGSTLHFIGSSWYCRPTHILRVHISIGELTNAEGLRGHSGCSLLSLLIQ